MRKKDWADSESHARLRKEDRNLLDIVYTATFNLEQSQIVGPDAIETEVAKCIRREIEVFLEELVPPSAFRQEALSTFERNKG